MAGARVHTVQGKVFGEIAQTEESFQCGILHLHHIAEAHVILDQRCNLLRFLIRKTQAPADVFGDADADFDMSVEADASGSAGRRGCEGGGLSHIVQERSPSQCWRCAFGKLL